MKPPSSRTRSSGAIPKRRPAPRGASSFYLIAIGFLVAGALPLYNDYRSRHDPELGAWVALVTPSPLTADNLIAALLIVIGVALLFRKAWARTVALGVLLAWIVEWVLLTLAFVLFLERIGVHSLLGVVLLGKLLGSMGAAGTAAATRDGVSAMLAVITHPIAARLVALGVGAMVVALLCWAYRRLRDHAAIDSHLGPATLAGRSVRVLGRNLTIPLLAAAYLCLPYLPLVGRLPAIRALSAEGRQVAKWRHEAEQRQREAARGGWLMDLGISSDLESLIVFSARKGAARIRLSTGEVDWLDPSVFSYVGSGQGGGYPEKVHNRVTPDHQWFLNRADELVRISDGSKRTLFVGRDFGRPVVFLSPRELLSLSPGGEFIWITLDPDRITRAAPSTSDGAPSLSQVGVPLVHVSPSRTALAYNVGDTPYVFDIASGRASRVPVTGKGPVFGVFSVEGDTVCLSVGALEGDRRVQVLVNVATGATTPMEWRGTPVYLSSANNIAIVEDQGATVQDQRILRAHAFDSPERLIWQGRHDAESYLHVVADGSAVLGQSRDHAQLTWARLSPLTGPAAWERIPLKAAPERKEYPRFYGDPGSQLAARKFGLKVQVLRVHDLHDAKAAVQTYDLERD